MKKILNWLFQPVFKQPDHYWCEAYYNRIYYILTILLFIWVGFIIYVVYKNLQHQYSFLELFGIVVFLLNMIQTIICERFYREKVD